MRNASKNTIKRVMRNASFYQQKGLYYTQKGYVLFNRVGAQIYIMSKGKIYNRMLSGLNKYISTKQSPFRG